MEINHWVKVGRPILIPHWEHNYLRVFTNYAAIFLFPCSVGGREREKVKVSCRSGAAHTPKSGEDTGDTQIHHTCDTCRLIFDNPNVLCPWDDDNSDERYGFWNNPIQNISCEALLEFIP